MMRKNKKDDEVEEIEPEELGVCAEG